MGNAQIGQVFSHTRLLAQHEGGGFGAGKQLLAAESEVRRNGCSTATWSLRSRSDWVRLIHAMATHGLELSLE